MKKYIVLLCILFGAIGFTQAQTAKKSAVKTETFAVNGNCGMCKSKIEKTAVKAGALSAKWNMEKHELTVKYKTGKTTIKAIQDKIAEAGYDNAGAVASNEAYEKLHSCCKYERTPPVNN
jgi:periplasmic mercuric ion binding protein